MFICLLLLLFFSATKTKCLPFNLTSYKIEWNTRLYNYILWSSGNFAFPCLLCAIIGLIFAESPYISISNVTRDVLPLSLSLVTINVRRLHKIVSQNLGLQHWRWRFLRTSFQNHFIYKIERKCVHNPLFCLKQTDRLWDFYWKRSVFCVSFLCQCCLESFLFEKLHKI